MKRPQKSPQRRAAVRLTRRALNDLREIERYSVTEWGRQAADKYLDDLESALNRIAENPQLLCLEPGLAAGLYFYRVKSTFSFATSVTNRSSS